MDEFENSLSGGATFAGGRGDALAGTSLGGEGTLGDKLADQETVIDDGEVVDLEARYKVEGTLGRGGMGEVLLALDTRLNRKVAIKRILGEAARSKTAISRFITEAKAIAALNHPNIVQIYDYGRAKDGPFLIMEYVDGSSLLDRCREGALPVEEAIDLACQLCDGLAKAHDLGIVHRDIKPANVLLTTDGVPKLTDFGLAKAEASDHQMTVMGAVLGTPDFMPPEQRRDASLVDARSDLWSLAATLYQMVTGRSPKIIRFRDVPGVLEEVLGKALEDSKDERFQTAREFRDAIKSAQTTAKPTAKPTAVAGALEEGQCKACGAITSDLTKKFCRNPECGAPLRVPCLKCESQIPVWDGVCGECGGNQRKLIAKKQAEFSKVCQQVEKKVAGLDFANAKALVRPWLDRDQRFDDLKNRASTLLSQLDAEERQVLERRDSHVREARVHFSAADYRAAVVSLEAIPSLFVTSESQSLLRVSKQLASEQLRQQSALITSQISSVVHAIGSQIARVGIRHEEVSKLMAEIREQIKNHNYDGMLYLVARALVLRRDRVDLRKLHDKLTARLKAKLRETVKQAKADGVVSLGESFEIVKLADEYLAGNPWDHRVRSLVEQCRRRAEDVLAECASNAIGKALVEKCQRMLVVQNSIGVRLRFVPAGTFTMGDADGGASETPHEVTLTQPFYLGVTQVTNAQWQAVMGTVPSMRKDADRPVERVSWEDAVSFCKKLSAMPDERSAGREYRLPTEAEWEYACRAGTTTAYSFGEIDEYFSWSLCTDGVDDDGNEFGGIEEGTSNFFDYGWCSENSEKSTHPVGTKQPNAWGFYDMHGNVAEWCSDWYGEYPGGAVTDPQGPSTGSFRVRRGGSWLDTARFCRSAYRFWHSPSDRSFILGFRLALSPSGAEPPEAGK